MNVISRYTHLQLVMLVCLTGTLVCQLTESLHRISGITVLSDKLYLLRCRDTDQIEVYNVVIHFSSLQLCLQRFLTLPRLYRDDWNDLTSSAKHHCLYVSNFSMDRIQRVDPDDGSVVLWPMSGAPCGLSMTRNDNLLVMFQDPKNPGKV